MGITKTELFSDQQNRIAKAAKALAHPARIAIIQALLDTNSCVNGDFVMEIGLSQPTISQHLRELKDAGIIRGSIEGTSIRYCIDPAGWALIQDAFNKLFISSYGDNPCCNTPINLKH